MRSSRLGIGSIIVGLFVAACIGATPSPASETTPAATSTLPAASSDAVSAHPSTTPSPTPTALLTEAPSPTVSASDSPATETFLLSWLRSDAQVACVPTRILPFRSTAGVECHPNTKLVSLVGVYGFSSQDDAFRTYRERLAGYGVKLRTGDCWAGKAGDASWIPGDGPAAGRDWPTRSGCYLDNNRLANVRVTCGSDHGVYIGIVGKAADLRALYTWAWQFPKAALAAGKVGAPSAPGICYGSALWRP